MPAAHIAAHINMIAGLRCRSAITRRGYEINGHHWITELVDHEREDGRASLVLTCQRCGMTLEAEAVYATTPVGRDYVDAETIRSRRWRP